METFNVYTKEEITKRFIKKSEENRCIFDKTLNIVTSNDKDNESSENILYMNRNGDLIEAIKMHHEDFNYDKSKITKITIAHDTIPHITEDSYRNPATSHWKKKPLLDKNGRETGTFIEHPDLIKILLFCKREFKNLRKNSIEIIVLVANQFIDKRLAENITFAIVAHKHKNPHASSLMEYLVFCQGRNTYRCMSNLLNIEKQKYHFAKNLCISSLWNYPSDYEGTYKVMMTKKRNIELLLALTLSSNVINLLIGAPLNDRIVYMENKANFFLDTSPVNRNYATITAEIQIDRPEPLEVKENDIPNRNRTRIYNSNPPRNLSYTPRNIENPSQEVDKNRDLPQYRIRIIDENQQRQSYNRTSPNLRTIENNPSNRKDEAIIIDKEINNIIIDKEQITIKDQPSVIASKSDKCKAVMQTIHKDLAKANICIPNSESTKSSKILEDKIAQMKYELILTKEKEIEDERIKAEEEEKQKIFEREEEVRIEEETKRTNQEIIDRFPFTTTDKLGEMEQLIKRKFDSMDSKIDLKFDEILEYMPNKKVKMTENVMEKGRQIIVNEDILQTKIKQLENKIAKLEQIDRSEKTTLLTKIEELKNEAMLVNDNDTYLIEEELRQAIEEKNEQLEIIKKKDEEIASLKKQLEYKDTNEIMLQDNVFKTDQFVLEIETSMHKAKPETTLVVIQKINKFVADKFEQYEVENKPVHENTKTIVNEIITNLRFYDDIFEPTPSTSEPTPSTSETQTQPWSAVVARHIPDNQNPSSKAPLKATKAPTKPKTTKPKTTKLKN